jgi:cell division protein ZapD
MSSNSILYEIPLNQRARDLLRLERIFRETLKQIDMATESSHFNALKQVYILLDFFERGDFKAQLIKTLDREIAYYAKLKDNPAVDLSKLDVFIKQLAQLNRWAKSQDGKIGHQLLKNNFLDNSRKKLTLDSARLSFDAPAVKCFLAKDPLERQEHLLNWLKAFKGVQTSVEVILRLSRDTGFFQTTFAEDGFYEEEYEKEQYQFIGIALPNDLNLFPEVSTGPGRFCIQFKQLDEELTSQEFNKWFDFELAKYR